MKTIILLVSVLFVVGCSSDGELKRSPCACNEHDQQRIDKML